MVRFFILVFFLGTRGLSSIISLALIVHSPCNATTSQVCCKEMNNSDQLIGFPSFKVKHQVTGVSQRPLFCIRLWVAKSSLGLDNWDNN